MQTYGESLGSVIVFEGHAKTISTQLRLLPTSPQLLILPDVHCYFSSDELETDFDARTYIKKVHDALLARHQVAQDFLRGSTSDNKRLVFMNGGAPSAKYLCIRTIMIYETDGDCAQAEAIFNDIVRDGMSGLNNPLRDWGRGNMLRYWDEKQSDEEIEDPITRQCELRMLWTAKPPICSLRTSLT